MYIIDTNVLIYAYNKDFPPQKDPGNFWDWLSQMNKKRTVVVPEEVFKEIKNGNDGLYDFLVKERNIEKWSAPL